MRDPALAAELRAKGRTRLEQFDPALNRQRLGAELIRVARAQEERSSRGRRRRGRPA